MMQRLVFWYGRGTLGKLQLILITRLQQQIMSVPTRSYKVRRTNGRPSVHHNLSAESAKVSRLVSATCSSDESEVHPEEDVTAAK